MEELKTKNNKIFHKKYILFDLDGTLIDPALGFGNAWEFALKKYNICVEDMSVLNSFIGLPIQDSFIQHFGFSQQQAIEAHKYFRDYIMNKGIFEYSVYNGIISLLNALKNAEKTLILASSKLIEFSDKTLQHAGIDIFFSFISGSERGKTGGKDIRTDKAEVIAFALEQCNISNLSEAVMIGDKYQDIIGAKQNNISSIGVSYGYGSLEELQKAQPDYIANTPIEIAKILCK